MSGRQSHAYLFVGARGTGKTTCAKILSRAINCLNPVNGDPCNECASCVGIENGSILDVLELDAASNNGIDDVRALREEAIYSPATVNKRVYIIDEAHMLSTPAFNALLKILEEPPEHLVFILATTALHKVPATILSRCQRFSFKRISPAAIIERLNFVAEKEGVTLADEAAQELAALADGSMRDALSLLDQCASDTVVDLQRVLDTIGLVGRREIQNLVDAVADRDAITAIDIFERVYDDGRDIAALLSEMASLLRDVLVYKLTPDSPLQSGGFSSAGLSALSAKFSAERLFSYLDIIREAVFGLSRGVNAKLTVEMSLIRMCDERLSDDASALLSRISRLESAIESGVQNSEHFANSELNQKTPADCSQSKEFESEAVRPDVNSRPSAAQDTTPIHSESTEDSESAETIDVQDLVPVNSEFRIPDSESNDTPGEPASDPYPPAPSPYNDYWQSILEHLKSDDSIYSLLSDSSRVHTELQGNVLFIRAGDIFTIGLIESKKFSEPLLEIIRKVLGPDTMMRVEVGGDSTEERKTKKIDDLDKFDIVKFE